MPRRLAALMLLLAGCGEEPAAPAKPNDATSTSGLLHAVMHTTPQPPQRGANSARVEFTDVHGSPVDGLKLKVELWMPQHSHGSSVLPTVEAEPGGVYLLSDLVLPMPGTWQLRTTVVGATSDELILQLEIP